MYAIQMSEGELARHVEEFCDELGLVLKRKEVSLGALRLDAVATDDKGDWVVIELKVNASRDTLAQLLLYPHAVEKVASRLGAEMRPVRSLLITTHLDENVVELVEEVKGVRDIQIKVCVDTEGGGLQLVDPADAGTGQVWDQSEGPCSFPFEHGCRTEV